MCWNSSEPPSLEVINTTYSENVHDETLNLDDSLCTYEDVLLLLEHMDPTTLQHICSGKLLGV